MGPKKCRRVRKIEVHTDSIPEFKLGDTAADIRQRREEREARERGTETEREGQEGGNRTLTRGGSCRKACKDRQKGYRNEDEGEGRTGFGKKFSS